MTRLVCSYGCSTLVPVLSGATECPRCGGLLDPLRDVARLRRTSASTWRKRIAERMSAGGRSSGVWTFHEWVLPEVAARDHVMLGEGNAPLVEGPDVGVRLLVKQCGQQPTGSFKDLGMTVLVSAARAMRRRKLAAAPRALVCASTGDTSAALAAYGARAGVPVVVLLPRGKVSPAQLVQPRAHGAIVVEVDGDFDACMRVVRDVGKQPGFLLANSKNPLRLLGQATVAYEIARDLGWRAPDVVIVPSGNLGNVGAMFAGFSLLKELGLVSKVPRLVAAQVAAADPFHRAISDGGDVLKPVRAGDTLATAIRIGDPVSFPRALRAIRATAGLTTSCSEAELVAGMRALDRSGLLSCPQTGAALAGLEQLVAARALKKRDLVVLVSTASGMKFSEAKSGAEANMPVRAAASVDAVMAALAEAGIDKANAA